MHRRLAKALLQDIYYPVSAVVSVGERGELLNVHLFDTAFGGERMAAEPEAAQLWLLSNHADGSTALYEADVQNFQRLKRLAASRPARLFLASEEFECREVNVYDAGEEGEDDDEEDAADVAAVSGADGRCG